MTIEKKEHFSARGSEFWWSSAIIAEAKQGTPTSKLSLLWSLAVSGELTEGLLVHDEAADDTLVAASQSEAVPPQNDVERLCGMQTRGRLDACHCICLEDPATPVGNCTL